MQIIGNREASATSVGNATSVMRFFGKRKSESPKVRPSRISTIAIYFFFRQKCEQRWQRMSNLSNLLKGTVPLLITAIK